ncbi:hypothetical protein C8Q74DRAFT_1226773 [Fomes fomentarius]|nr:hypothetical protein C8Q74DRAFT_1226773 [Fomes fomentarius]
MSTQNSRRISISPSPVITHHHSSSPHPLPTRDLLGSIASGAHYSGSLQHPDDPPLHARRWRARSRDRSTEDPEVQAYFKGVMDDLGQLYCCKPTFEVIHRRFRDNATIEHPLFTSIGVRNIAAVLFAMVRFVAGSERVSTRILSAGLSPNRLIYTQTQIYTLRLVGFKKEITSIVFVDLDDDMRVVQLIDQWDGEEHSTRWGASSLRRLVTRILSWTVHVPGELGRARAGEQ